MVKLFTEIDAFELWADSIPVNYRSGEWECDYMKWDDIYKSFHLFLNDVPCSTWTQEQTEAILYIIARDNEMEELARQVAEKQDVLFLLSKQSFEHGESDVKWQLASKLSLCKDKAKAEELLLQYVQDENEYVNRRALMTLAKTGSKQTEKYCQLAWDRDIYGEMQEYQRIAVLHSLDTIHSVLLPKYIELAQKDGRKYLLMYAIKIASEYNSG